MYWIQWNLLLQLLIDLLATFLCSRLPLQVFIRVEVLWLYVAPFLHNINYLPIRFEFLLVLNPENKIRKVTWVSTVFPSSAVMWGQELSWRKQIERWATHILKLALFSLKINHRKVFSSDSSILWKNRNNEFLINFKRKGHDFLSENVALAFGGRGEFGCSHYMLVRFDSEVQWTHFNTDYCRI